MRFGSVCSGVECARLAFPKEWKYVFSSEIEPYPCEVLKKHYPDVPNMGDMTKIYMNENGEITNGTDVVIQRGGIDLLCGGTPCQDVSVAGKRAGMVDGETRSGLAFQYKRLAYTLGEGGKPVRWLVWENVPGVFSSNGGEDFGRFLAELAGWDRIDVPKRGWRNFGIVPPKDGGCFGLAWRVLDAQFTRTPMFPYAIPQRRRRVWLVGYSGDWRPAARVLFESEGVLWHSEPRRETGKGTARYPQGKSDIADCGVESAGGNSDAEGE